MLRIDQGKPKDVGWHNFKVYKVKRFTLEDHSYSKRAILKNECFYAAKAAGFGHSNLN